MFRARRGAGKASIRILQSSPSFVHPDVTLRLDPAGVIQRAVFSNAFAGEAVSTWVGRRWAETVSEGDTLLQRVLEDAWTSGLSPVLRVRQRFASGRELPIEYTTVRLGGDAGLIAIGRSLEAVADVRSRLTADKSAMERSSWKLREVETRSRVVADASEQPVVLIHAGDLRIIEANAHAVRELGVACDGQLVPETSTERATFQSMLERLREQERVPGIVLHFGSERRAWLVRASLVTEWAPLFLLHLSPAGLGPSPASPGALDRAAMREIVEDAVSAVERQCIVTALKSRSRDDVAKMMGITVEALDAKLEGHATDDGKKAGST